MTHSTMQVATRYRGSFVVLYYVLTIITGIFVLFFHGREAVAADVIATVFYLVLTAFFYDLSKRVSRDREH